MRQRAPERPAGRRHRQPPRLPASAKGGRASAASSTPNRRARWRTSSKPPSALGTPLIYLQDVSGFMVGPEAEREGIIRAGAEMVESMSCATVPKIVLTLNHASGAGYYAMAGQGFDPNFTFSWPTRAHRRDGRRFGRAGALSRSNWRSTRRRASRCRRSCSSPSTEPAPITSAGSTRATPPRAATCDAVIDPQETREVLSHGARSAHAAPARPKPLALETL